ncbi:MAG: hypothetical protein M3220_14060 [Chloroflexota bacterium]|nr:hypothetical protein [Chloroflexota bacterium]
MVRRGFGLLRLLLALLLLVLVIFQGRAVAYAQGDVDEFDEFLEEDFSEVRDGDELRTPVDIPPVTLRDIEGNVIGEADFNWTRRSRLLLEIDAVGIDPNRQRVAVAPARVCETEDFEMVGREILDLSQFTFLEDPIPAREFLAVLPRSIADDLFVEEGSAIVVHRGRSVRSDIIACGVIDEGITAGDAAFVDEEDEVHTGLFEAVEDVREGQWVDLALLTSAEHLYEGQTIRTQGEVDDVLASNAFMLESGELVANEVLVISRNERAFQLDRSLRLREDRGLATTRNMAVVEGEVRDDFDIITVEEELGFDLDDEVFEVFEAEGTGVIIADRVNFSPNLLREDEDEGLLDGDEELLD